MTAAARSFDPTSDAAREQAATALARALLAVLAVPSTAANATSDHLVTRKTSGLDAKTFDALVRDGSLPARKLGRTWYARHSDVLALIGRMQTVRDAAAASPATTDDASDPTTLAGALARANARRQRRAELAAARASSSR